MRHLSLFAGWCGFFVPALIRLVEYLRHPFATEMVPVDNSSLIRSSVVGWFAISLACWVVNFCPARLGDVPFGYLGVDANVWKS